jgi:hypothetical protein
MFEVLGFIPSTEKEKKNRKKGKKKKKKKKYTLFKKLRPKYLAWNKD